MKHFFSGARRLVVGGRWLFFFSALLFPPAKTFATTLFCQISSFSSADRTLKVSCTVSDFPAAGKVKLQFADRFAGIEGLSERVYGLQIKDTTGRRLLPEILGSGVYRVNPNSSPQITLEYQLRLAEVT